MNTMAVAVVLIVALAASGIGTGLAVLLKQMRRFEVRAGSGGVASRRSELACGRVSIFGGGLTHAAARTAV